MRRSSLGKWTILFAATGILSVMFFERAGLNTILGAIGAIGAIYALVAALGLLTMAAEAARTSIADRLLAPLLRVAFTGMGVALVVGLPVAASQL